jgi:hypothetical protein
MNIKFHIFLFLFSLLLYLFIGLYAIFTQSIIIGLIYLIILVLSSIALAYFCCTKCRFNEDSCLHKIPGILTKILPKRKGKKFTIYDRYVIYLTSVVIILIPQIWLWNIKYLFVIFWTLVLINIIENTILFDSRSKK